uniref:Uncharacterized protein n=1 Tax=Quercus lobata TaxID=97700 RepID=A0A7N2LEE9_QUELO
MEGGGYFHSCVYDGERKDGKRKWVVFWKREGMENVWVYILVPPLLQYLRVIDEINKPISFNSNVFYFPSRLGLKQYVVGSITFAVLELERTRFLGLLSFKSKTHQDEFCPEEALDRCWHPWMRDDLENGFSKWHARKDIFERH